MHKLILKVYTRERIYYYLFPLLNNYPHSRQRAKLFLKSSELGLLQPLTRRRVRPPPPLPGEWHTRWRERGWESPNSDEGTYSVVLCIYKYFVHLPFTPDIYTSIPKDIGSVCRVERFSTSETMIIKEDFSQISESL